MFLPLWNVQLGAEVRVRMSDGKVLVYRVTEVHANVSCPDTEPPMDPNPPNHCRSATAPGTAGRAPSGRLRPTDMSA